MVDVVKKLPAITILIFEVIENDSFENMVEIANMSQIMNVVGKCALTMTVMVKASDQIEPLFQKVTKYALFYSFVIVIKIRGEFYAIAAVRDPSMLDI